MTACPHCQYPLLEPTPPQCPACGGLLAAPAAPLPDTPAPEAPPADEPPAAEPSPGARPPVVPPPLPAGPWPPAPASDGGSHAPGFVWDRRDTLGLASAFVETSRQVLAAPTAFFRAMPVAGGIGSPLLYAVLAGWLGIAAAALYQGIWVSIAGPAQLPFGFDSPELAEYFTFFSSWFGLGIQLVFGGVSMVISVFVTSAILHVALLVTGGARNGFEATFRVVSFAQATMLLLLLPLFLIPLCGLVGVVWALVLYVIGLAEAQQVGQGRALGAVLLPIVVLCCCCGGLLLLFAGTLASLVGGQIH